jgi:hypothetical protein
MRLTAIPQYSVPIAGWSLFAPGLVALAYNVWLLKKSQQYHGLRPGESVRSGSAPFWQLNVLNPRTSARRRRA